MPATKHAKLKDKQKTLNDESEQERVEEDERGQIFLENSAQPLSLLGQYQVQQVQAQRIIVDNRKSSQRWRFLYSREHIQLRAKIERSPAEAARASPLLRAAILLRDEGMAAQGEVTRTVYNEAHQPHVGTSRHRRRRVGAPYERIEQLKTWGTSRKS